MQINEDDIKNCVLCGNPLPETHPGRNNAEPLKEGICCDECNWAKVIPARLKQHQESQQ